MVETRTPREQLLARWTTLKSERSSWIEHWRDISDVVLPRNGRWMVSDRNKGTKRHNNIYDSTGTKALRTLAAGLMAGMTSPARPWFRLTTSDPDLAEFDTVKTWLSDTTAVMSRVFTRSNTYRALHSMYEEEGAFGTAGSIIVGDDLRVLHHHPLTAGEYAIATNWRGEVDTLYREFDVTVDALVREFGLDAVSDTVRSAYTSGSLDKWVTVVHAIEPRREREPGKRDAGNMPWRSVYFELAGDSRKVLRESGFNRFPAVCPRWSVVGGDVYGNSPGMEALGDVRQLLQEQLRKSQGIDYITNPPLQVPSALRNQPHSTLPGGVAYYDATAPHGGIRSQFDVRLDLNHLLMDIQDVRGRIRSAFYSDLFLMISGGDLGGRMTATEVAERHEEKLLMLGPVLERQHNELLDPKIEITFDRMLAAGVVPPPPQELQGADLNVEFVSMLAQAQKAVATNAVDRFVLTLGQVAAIKPDVIDKLDADHWADAYADMLGIDPEMITADANVALVRKARAEAAQQQAQSQQAVAQSQAIKNLGQTPVAGGNVIDMFSNGFGAAAA